jgi:glycosyltransferase involved in cell wall biosynthesis
MADHETDSAIDLSIVIPARNEERYLPLALDAIERAANRFAGSHEVIVVLNRCTDGTEAIARARGCRIATEDAKNLAAIRNAGARIAHGRLLITVDADSRMSANMLEQVARTMEDGRYIGGAVQMWPERWSMGVVLTFMCLLPIAIREGILGGLFFCERETFEAIGGFDERFVTVEDIDFAKRLKAYGEVKGRKFKKLFRASITTSCRKFDHFGDWYFLRNPKEFRRAFLGTDQAVGNKIWYDFKR